MRERVSQERRIDSLHIVCRGNAFGLVDPLGQWHGGAMRWLMVGGFGGASSRSRDTSIVPRLNWADLFSSKFSKVNKRLQLCQHLLLPATTSLPGMYSGCFLQLQIRTESTETLPYRLAASTIRSSSYQPMPKMRPRAARLSICPVQARYIASPSALMLWAVRLTYTGLLEAHLFRREQINR